MHHDERTRLRDFLIDMAESVRFRHVLSAVFVVAFAPELLSAVSWAVPITVDIGSSSAVDALASNATSVLVVAALIYVPIRVARSVVGRRRPRNRV